MHLSNMLIFALQILGVLSRAQIQQPMDPSESDLPPLDAPPEANCTCTPFYECHDEESSSILNNVVNDRTVITVSEDSEPGECLDILDICCYNLGPASVTSESGNHSPQTESPSLLDVSTQDLNTTPPIQPGSPSSTEISNHTPTTSPLPRTQTPNPSGIALQFPSSDTSPSPSEISPTQPSTTNTLLLQPQTTVSPGGVSDQHIENIGSCGIRNSEGVDVTIKGFKDGQAQYGEFPWMVAVLRSGEGTGATNLYVGGGSLIDPIVVLTAAHKAFDNNGTLSVRIGEWNFASTSEPIPHQDIPVSEIIYHPRFDRERMIYNYALLILGRPAIMGATVGTICLPKLHQLGQPFDSEQCILSGWGKDIFGEKGRHQRILKSVSVNMVGFAQCQTAMQTSDKLNSTFKLHQSFVCAGDEGKDACTGDGGSPLVCPDPENPGKYVQVGISAWGIECNQKGIPGVYSGVNRVPWIIQQLEALQALPLEITDKVAMAPASRCPTRSPIFVEKHQTCISCPDCHTYNPRTFQCNRKFRCSG